MAIKISVTGYKKSGVASVLYNCEWKSRENLDLPTMTVNICAKIKDVVCWRNTENPVCAANSTFLAESLTNILRKIFPVCSDFSQLMLFTVLGHDKAFS